MVSVGMGRRWSRKCVKSPWQRCGKGLCGPGVGDGDISVCVPGWWPGPRSGRLATRPKLSAQPPNSKDAAGRLRWSENTGLNVRPLCPFLVFSVLYTPLLFSLIKH